MLYKPNFCCNCGEKIERIDWNLLTSRRFCDTCAAENKRHDNIPKAAVAGGILAMVFGLGTLMGGNSSTPPNVQMLSAAPVASKPAERPAERRAPEAPASAPSPTPSMAGTPQPEVVRSAPAKAFYCGALTKKGTPCSRKVKVQGVRCYQHEGKPAATDID